MESLQELEDKSVHIIREAVNQFKNPAVLWSTGKDSTTTLQLIRKAFFGKIPFPVIHIDTGYKFPEMYKYRDNLAKEWNFKLIVAKNEEAIKNGMGPEKGRFECCTQLKTEALKQFLKKHKFDALILSIRRDEHGIRAKERVFSPRDKDFKWDFKNQPAEVWDMYRGIFEDGQHIRVHPILHWTEFDIWRYVKQEKLPINPLYFARNGKRFRSLGCMPCTHPIDSEADTIDKIVEELRTTKTSERAGRSQDKEKTYMMGKLRALGYM